MFRFITLCKLDFPTPIFLTDFHRNYTYNGDTYLKGKLQVSSNVIQKAEPSANKFDLILSAVDQTIISVFTTQNYKNRNCTLLRAYIDDNEQITSVENWLIGDMEKYTYTGKTDTSEFKVTVSSIFGAFDSVTSVDLGVLYSEHISNDKTIFWGKEAQKASGSTGGGGSPSGQDGFTIEN